MCILCVFYVPKNGSANNRLAFLNRWEICYCQGNFKLPRHFEPPLHMAENQGFRPKPLSHKHRIITQRPKRKTQLPDKQIIALTCCDLDGTRTHDSLIKSQVLYRLSYEINEPFFKSGAKILSSSRYMQPFPHFFLKLPLAMLFLATAW